MKPSNIPFQHVAQRRFIFFVHIFVMKRVDKISDTEYNQAIGYLKRITEKKNLSPAIYENRKRGESYVFVQA